MVTVKLTSDPKKTTHYLLHGMQQLTDNPILMRMTTRSHAWRPPTDVYETEDAIVVRVEIAGMNDADFSIVLDRRFLMIRGVRAEPPERRAYHQMEIRFGEFGTDIELPFPVVESEIEAVYSHGFLHIVLPKARPKKVHIEDEH